MTYVFALFGQTCIVGSDLVDTMLHRGDLYGRLILFLIFIVLCYNYFLLLRCWAELFFLAAPYPIRSQT